MGRGEKGVFSIRRRSEIDIEGPHGFINETDKGTAGKMSRSGIKNWNRSKASVNFCFCFSPLGAVIGVTASKLRSIWLLTFFGFLIISKEREKTIAGRRKDFLSSGLPYFVRCVWRCIFSPYKPSAGGFRLPFGFIFLHYSPPSPFWNNKVINLQRISRKKTQVHNEVQHMQQEYLKISSALFFLQHIWLSLTRVLDTQSQKEIARVQSTDGHL